MRAYQFFFKRECRNRDGNNPKKEHQQGRLLRTLLELGAKDTCSTEAQHTNFGKEKLER